MTSRAQTIPETFVIVNVHISGSVKTYQTSKPDINKRNNFIDQLLVL